jgi:hypothetical protein
MADARLGQTVAAERMSNTLQKKLNGAERG